MTGKVISLDCETTSLRWDRKAWEIALVWRDENGQLTSRQWYIHTSDLDLANADPFSLRIGGFYRRHPAPAGEPITFSYGYPPSQPLEWVVRDIWRLTIDATIVGASVQFDTHIIERELRQIGLQPAWDHRLRCVSTLASGFACREVSGLRGAVECMGLDWDESEAHGAVYDATKALEVYEAIMANRERENI